MQIVLVQQIVLQVCQMGIEPGAVAIIMAANKMAFWSIATQSIVYVSIVSIGSWYYSRWRPSRQITFKPIKEMFGFSCKMLITGIFNNINKFAFESTMGSFYPTKSIGAYSQANKWNQMGSQTIIGMVQSVAQPMFVQVGDDLERQQRVFRKMLRFTAFAAIALSMEVEVGRLSSATTALPLPRCASPN